LTRAGHSALSAAHLDADLYEQHGYEHAEELAAETREAANRGARVAQRQQR
jgi:hypothetical protein